MSSPPGRGAHYGFRRITDAVLRLAYRGDWPAKLWQRFPNACRVRCVHHALPILRTGARPIRIGFVSDLHIGPTTPARLLDAAFEELSRLALDVLLLGGDYVLLDATTEKADRLTALIRRVPAAHKVAVLGNHDLWTEHAILEAALARADVRLLENAHHAIDGATIVGLDEPWTGALDAPRAFAGVRDGDPIVVLCHSPDGLPAATSAMPAGTRALYVCGHTHGGHFSTPWGPVFVPGRVGKQFPHGFHKGSKVDLYVSRGVGGAEIPVRAWAPPDVAVFDLVPAGVDTA